MAIIPQKKLFAWTEIQPLGDLKRLQLVLDYMPDEDLVRTLEKKRGQGRDDYRIKPVIDIRNTWKDEDKTRLLADKKNVVYNYKGNVFCYCPVTGVCREMPGGGFEKDRGTLKKICPARRYGIKCKGQEECPVAQGIRVAMSEDRRIFTPIDRAGYKWKREYNKRPAVERVNSRLDVSFGFEVHTIRGQRKMKLRCSLALCVMLAMALGRIKENQEEKLRSLVACG